MPRGLSVTLKAALNGVNIDGPIYAVRITRTSDVLRWAEQAVTIHEEDAADHAYAARLKSVSGIGFSIQNAAQVSIQAANIDGQVTLLDQSEDFSGARVEVLEFLPSAIAGGEFHLRWTGYADSITDLNAESATIPAYAGTAANIQIPRFATGLNCPWEFANIANFVNGKNYEGSECPYGKDANTGFRAALQDTLDATTDPVTFTILWDTSPFAAGAVFEKGDVVKIGSEKFLATLVTDPTVGREQDLTCQRGYFNTTLATHAIADVAYFGHCQKSTYACVRRGMYGNNGSDVYSPSKKHNYFGGVPIMTA